jgi:hypothetical protein
MPEFPEINFRLGTRKTVTKEVQNAILDEVRKISWHINPRIYIGICWLRTYISVRPGELIKLLEKHIELSFGKGYLVFPEHKVDRYGNVKRVPLIDEDIWTLSDIPRGMPDLHFFRHINKRKGVQVGTPFGERYLYKWWIQACENLGIKGVDLYGRYAGIVGYGSPSRRMHS